MHVLDTDYETFAFLCLENTNPAQQSLACQYLGAQRLPEPRGRGLHDPEGQTCRRGTDGGGLSL